MALESGPAKTDRNWWIVFTLLAVGMAGYFVYDGAVGYLNDNRDELKKHPPANVDREIKWEELTEFPTKQDFAEFQQYESGECVYCNHCLPCPVVIDIGQIIRMMETAQQRMTVELQAAYDALTARASDCTGCGACVERCPFGVDVVAKMTRAVELFEEAAG